jgi:hypothetical protein
MDSRIPDGQDVAGGRCRRRLQLVPGTAAARLINRSRLLVAPVFLTAALAGCGSSSSAPAPTPTPVRTASKQQLVASIRTVLITRFHVDRRVAVQCGSGSPVIRDGQKLQCTAVSSAGMGYGVAMKLPCWSASFDGEIIEGPGFVPPGHVRAPSNVPTGPDNLPNRFSGCLG